MNDASRKRKRRPGACRTLRKPCWNTKSFLTALYSPVRMIGRDLAGFLEGGLSVHLGSRDESLRPRGARALAIIVSDDGLQATVYVAAAAAARLIPLLERSRQAAVNLGRPVDDRACQVKGVLADIRPATADERPRIDAQWRGLVEQLRMVGITPEATSGWATWPAVAVTLRVTAVFEQTPGPQAGVPLE